MDFLLLGLLLGIKSIKNSDFIHWQWTGLLELDTVSHTISNVGIKEIYYRICLHFRGIPCYVLWEVIVVLIYSIFDPKTIITSKIKKYHMYYAFL